MAKFDDLHPIDAVRALVLTGERDPRMLQTVFALFVALDCAVLTAGGSDLELVGWPVAGLLLTALTTVLAYVVPWRRLDPRVVTLLPVLDIAALGAWRIIPGGSAAGILVVVPALWLGGQLGRRGALVVVVAVATLAALPGMVVLGADALQLSRAVLITVVAGWSALTLAFSLERLRCERDAAERRGTELAAAMATIGHQERASQAIFEAVDIGLVLLDRDGLFRTHNRRQQEFLELAHPQGYQGRAGEIGLVFGSDGGTPMAAEDTPTYRAARGEEFEDHRIWVGSNAAARRALSVSARALRAPDGTFEGAVLAYKDVTDLVRALAVRDDFVASVSHELRTPLTSIAGHVELLRDRGDLPDEVAGQLEVVERNAMRLLRLIGDLLQSAQITSGGSLPLVRRKCDLVEIVRDAVEAVGPAAQAADLTLEMDLPDTLWLTGDDQRLGQLAENLLTNAVKYTPAGGRVNVALASDGSWAELVVADTGIGIDAESREKLFTRFFRAPAAEQRAIPGVGLGLSICHDIVTSHGGRIEVESEAGVGSAFRARLPLGE